jgi:hypothetical protein
MSRLRRVGRGQRCVWVLPILVSAACSGGHRSSGATPAGGAGRSAGDAGASGAGVAGSSGGGAGVGGQLGSAGAPPADGGRNAGDAGDGGFAVGGRAGAAPGAGSGGAGPGGATQAGGSTGAAGTAGGVCHFDIQDALSPAMPTVGVVTWSTDLAGLTDARIEFTLADPAPDEINRGSGGPIDVAGETHRALLLGLKSERPYTYRIIARAGNTVCTSPDRALTAGKLVTGVPQPEVFLVDVFQVAVTRNAQAAAAPSPGFILSGNSLRDAFVFDTDGDIVWWMRGTANWSRVRMDWEGQNLWMLVTNGAMENTGEVRRISMDGTEILDTTLTDAHHDLAVLPGGIVATLIWTRDTAQTSTLVERSPDGTVKTVAKIDSSVFPAKPTYHANSLAYHGVDDTYTVGDLNAVGYVKLTRSGKVLWQFLAGCPGGLGTKCASGSLTSNHGHHLLDDGRFLFINSRMSPAPVYEYRLTESPSALSASQIWSYPSGPTTEILGDVQRLPNGNTLITYSIDGEMREVSPAGEVVQTITSGTLFGAHPWFGYADFRQTLYGPPPR